MKKKYFNKRAKKRRKANLKKNAGERFSKRMGGVIGVSMLVENRDVNARSISQAKDI